MAEFYTSLEAISVGLSEVQTKLISTSKISPDGPEALTKENQPIATAPGATQPDHFNAAGPPTLEQEYIKTRRGIDELTRDVNRAIELTDTATQEFHQLVRECIQLWYQNSRLRRSIVELGQTEGLTDMSTDSDEFEALLRDHLSQASVSPTPELEAFLPEVSPFVQQILLAINSQIEIDWLPLSA